MITTRFRAGAVALALLLAVVPAATAQAPATPFVDSLRRVLPDALTQQRVPGVAVALVRNGEVVWSGGFGVADTVTRAPVTDRTVFQVASISKSVAAWGFLKLVEQNKLQLDAPVERYLKRWHLPEARLPNDEKPPADINSRVTLRRLLSHTAGLTPSGYPGFHPDSGVPSLEQNLSGQSNGVGGVRVTLLPGTQYRYAGGGFTLAQLVSEEVSGRGFADYMQATVLQPLGMQNSAYVWTAELKPLTAAAYDRNGARLPNYIWIEQAAAGLYTTAPSLARFVAAGMRGPRGEPPGRGVLRPETVELLYSPAENARMPAPANATSPAPAYGLGHSVETLPGGTKVVGHAGSNRGWKARWAAAPARGLGLVVLTNGDTGGALHTQVLCLWYRVELQDAPAACR